MTISSIIVDWIIIVLLSNLEEIKEDSYILIVLSTKNIHDAIVSLS